VAWIFGLSAECGAEEVPAAALAGHFGAWPAGVWADSAANWWCSVAPGGLSRVGIGSEADASAMTSAGEALYERLRSAPAVYRNALVGVEVDGFRSYDELVTDEDLTRFPGLVLSVDTWVACGRPPGFVPFAGLSLDPVRWRAPRAAPGCSSMATLGR
jgi:hypothetical protein